MCNAVTDRAGGVADAPTRPEMPVVRRPIPPLPERPRVSPIGRGLRRSYPVGRQEFSRTYLGRTFEISVATDVPLPAQTLGCLDTTINSPASGEWITYPFERVSETTFRCRITPQKTGFFAFRARASLDGGATWVHDAVPVAWVLVDPPQVDGLRLYTLIPTVSGSIADWAADLPRIKSMGFNAVHLLPVTRLDESESPYSASDLFDLDHAYLMDGAKGDGLSQLEGFVERAAELDMRLCFDLVLNHVGVKSTMVKRAPSWIVPDPTVPDGNKRARYWSEGQWRTWDDLVLVNYEHPSEVTRAEIWRYMTEYALFWGRYADYTGGFVRLDNLHGSNQDFLMAAARALDREYPNVGVVAEFFTDDATLLHTVPECELNLVLATPWCHKYVPELRGYLRYLHRISDHIRYFMPITSHDSGSPAQEFAVAESTMPRYVAAALLGTGATGITQGVEWGIRERIDFIGRKPKLAWQGEAPYAALLRKVNEILARHEEFRSGMNCQFVDGDHHAVIAAFRRSAAGGGFLVVCNFDIKEPQQVSCDLSAMLGSRGTVRGRELLGGSEGQFSGGTTTLSLPPCGAMVWQLDPPG